MICCLLCVHQRHICCFAVLARRGEKESDPAPPFYLLTFIFSLSSRQMALG